MNINSANEIKREQKTQAARELRIRVQRKGGECKNSVADEANNPRQPFWRG
jgi:hypothetical protein